MKRLYKSATDKKFDGVCAGIGEYLDVDPTLIRAIYLFLTIVTGFFPGVIAYVLLMWLIPNPPEKGEKSGKKVK